MIMRGLLLCSRQTVIRGLSVQDRQDIIRWSSPYNGQIKTQEPKMLTLIGEVLLGTRDTLKSYLLWRGYLLYLGDHMRPGPVATHVIDMLMK